MPWWVWCILGFILLGSEILLPSGFYLFIIGLAALLVAALEGLGLGLPAWVQWCIFGVASAGLLVGTRKSLTNLMRPETPGTSSEIQGSEVLILADIEVDGEGPGELRGVPWKVRNRGQALLRSGSRARVDAVEGFTLIVHG